MKGSYEGVYVVGYGQTEYTKRTDKSIQRLIWEAIDKGTHIQPAAVEGRRRIGRHGIRAAARQRHGSRRALWSRAAVVIPRRLRRELPVSSASCTPCARSRPAMLMW